MSDDVILGIHSNVRAGQIDPETGKPYGFDAGHAWISITRDGNTTHHGLWPDAHPSVEDNGSGTDIRRGMEDRDTPAASRYFQLAPAQVQKLDSLLNENVTWSYTHNCSSWARDTVGAVTGIHLDADDPGALWTETPRQLGDSIHQLEQQRQTSPAQPAEPPAHENSSRSLDRRAGLSATSQQLLHDSEQHIRRIGAEHGLTWDTGMDNSVAAVARQARVDGLTGITHMKATGGVIRYAQAGDHAIQDGRIDAHEAANTSARDSLAALALADERQQAEPTLAGPVQLQIEMAAPARV